MPYDYDSLMELLLWTKARVHPWIRLNRVVRDIPIQYIVAGADTPNMREEVSQEMTRRGLRCRCIRCREVGGGVSSRAPVESARLVERRYAASGAEEVFLSFETPDEAVIFGFARLRLGGEPGAGVFACLAGAALVRELHVYGQLVPTSGAGDDGGGDGAAQHTGFGRRLMARAEEIAAGAGWERVAVIAGVGARNYYRRLGYELHEEGGFMLKRVLTSRHGGVLAVADQPAADKPATQRHHQQRPAPAASTAAPSTAALMVKAAAAAGAAAAQRRWAAATAVAVGAAAAVWVTWRADAAGGGRAPTAAGWGRLQLCIAAAAATAAAAAAAASPGSRHG